MNELFKYRDFESGTSRVCEPVRYEFQGAIEFSGQFP